MIVELTRAHLAELLVGNPVTLGDVIVRQGEGGVLEQRVKLHAGTPEPAFPTPAERRTDARQQLTGEPRFYMRSKWPGRCAGGCGARWERGERILRDAEAKKCYCVGCGSSLFPNVVDPRAVTA